MVESESDASSSSENSITDHTNDREINRADEEWGRAPWRHGAARPDDLELEMADDIFQVITINL